MSQQANGAVYHQVNALSHDCPCAGKRQAMGTQAHQGSLYQRAEGGKGSARHPLAVCCWLGLLLRAEQTALPSSGLESVHALLHSAPAPATDATGCWSHPEHVPCTAGRRSKAKQHQLPWPLPVSGPTQCTCELLYCEQERRQRSGCLGTSLALQQHHCNPVS